MDDKDKCSSKEGTSVLCNPAAIARRKRMEIRRFRKLSYSTDVIRDGSNSAQISLHLKRARPPANELSDLWEDFEDLGTPSSKLQKEEGRVLLQTKGKEAAEILEQSGCSPPNRPQDHKACLPWPDAACTATAQMVPLDMVNVSEQLVSRILNSELQNPSSAREEDTSSSQVMSENVLLECNMEADPSAISGVALSSVQSTARSSDSLSNQGCPPSGKLLLCGQRRVMEDRAAIVPSFVQISCDLTGSCLCKGKMEGEWACGLHFFAVYDGHGGSQASQFCMERLHLALADELAALCVVKDEECLPCDWQSVMASCFLRMDKELGGVCLNGHRDDVGTSGGSIASESVATTAIVAVVSSCQIVVASCGDSRAVLSRSGQAIPLSSNNKPQRKVESNCVEAVGEQVIFWDGHGAGGLLALSTTIGDQYLKRFVVPELEVTCIQRSKEDECLILASNGLWDVMTNEATCEITRKCLASSRRMREAGTHELGEDPASIAAAALLVKVAFGRGSKDNISVVVVDLKS